MSELHPNTVACHDELLTRFLEGQTTQKEGDRVIEHLDQCESCGEWLETQAAETNFWQTASVALSEGQDTVKSVSESHDAQATEHHAMLRQWCDPTTTPQALGLVGKYEIRRLVGRGGMGLVLEALDTEINRTVAIKTLLNPFASSSPGRERLMREATAVASLNHEHIITIHGVEQWRDVPFIVMPYVPGTLNEYGSQHRLSVPEILQVARQIASALDAAHSSGLVHRDIKPSNILLADGIRHTLLADFGIARTDGDATLTQPGCTPGTPLFMSPEQALGKPVDARSDLFSLGSLLYWLCTSRFPFQGDSNYATLVQLVDKEPTPIRTLNPKIPVSLVALIARLMTKAAEQRQISARRLMELLDECSAQIANPKLRLRSPELIPLRQDSSGWQSRLVQVPAGIALAVAVLAAGSYAALAFSARRPAHDTTRTSTPAPSETNSPRYGPLDEIDLANAVEDFQLAQHTRYWLRRLAYLQASEIPPELLPAIEDLSTGNDAAIRELALVILNKNPFEEVPPFESGMRKRRRPSSPPNSESASEEMAEVSPFVEVFPDSL